MAGLLEFIKSAAVRLFDPKQQERVSALAEVLQAEISSQRGAFNVDEAMRRHAVLPEDVDPVRREVYGRFLRRAWKDQDVTEKEQVALKWLARTLSLDSATLARLNSEAACGAFRTVLAAAIADGVLEDTEVKRLAAIAGHAGLSMREMVLSYFRNEGEGFLRGLFVSMVQDGRLTGQEWSSLLHAVQVLGFDATEFLQLIRHQGQQFLEHVLADAKADGRLSREEEATLRGLLDCLQPDPATRQYVEAELQQLRFLTDLSDGKLPVIASHELSLRAGEVLHHVCAATRLIQRRLSSGERWDEQPGTLAVTDLRMLFLATDKSCEISHRKVIKISSYEGGIHVAAGVKGAGYYRSGDPMLVPIYSVAVGRSNQTITEAGEELSSRHIPRGVRQRVWQKYMGRCAECGSTQYLEFDHVIPHSRGGSSTENNVQLLCRACNLKKSDLI